MLPKLVLEFFNQAKVWFCFINLFVVCLMRSTGPIFITDLCRLGQNVCKLPAPERNDSACLCA